MFNGKFKTADAEGDGARAQSAFSKRYFTSVKIAYLAMFVAINVVIGAFSPRLGSLKITLTYLICFLAGNFYGAIAGGIVGGLGDLLGCLIGGYAPNPIILISSVLIGVIPGLIRRINIKALRKGLPYFKIMLSFLVVFTVCTLFVNTYGLYLLGMAKGNTFWAYMGIRAATQSPIVAINLGVTLFAYPLFERLFKNTPPSVAVNEVAPLDEVTETDVIDDKA